MLKNFISLFKYFVSLVFPNKKVRVLMYHSVSDDEKFLSVPLENFEKQMAFIKKENYKILSLDEFKEIINKKTFSTKNLMLTFDDGYQDNYEIVYPLLKKYNFFAVIFLVIDLIGKENYLTWNQIKEMSSSGLIVFGSHTLSHPNLIDLGEAELTDELTKSNEIIERELGKSCLVFSYPRGYYNKKVLENVKNNGYSLAFTVKEGNFNGKGSPYEIPRLSIDKSTTWSQFLGKLSGYQIIKNRI